MINLGVGWPELIRDMREGSREPREPPQPTGLQLTILFTATIVTSCGSGEDTGEGEPGWLKTGC